jgi:hypothetical protein
MIAFLFAAGFILAFLGLLALAGWLTAKAGGVALRRRR